MSDFQPKKTRMIVVARSVSGGDTPNARVSNGNGPSVSAAGVSPRRVRDEQSGKIVSYAALGGEEDLDRFDKFLVEQERGPSASDFGSMPGSPKLTKRQSLTRGKDFAASDAKSDSIQPRAVDPKKRREEAIVRRKMLQSMPIHERLAHEREQAVLRRWNQINAHWEKFKARTAKKLGKDENQLVMSRAAAYREQVEMYDALQKARPVAEKVGNDVWLVSLRDDGTRFVPVGNIFSGLFCPIRESSRVGPQVRRPLDYYRARAALTEDDPVEPTVAPLSSMEKRSLELLERKKRRLRKRLEELLPHEVSASSKGKLVVESLDLFEWASTSSGLVDDTDDNSKPSTPILAGTSSAGKENCDSNNATEASERPSPREVTGPRLSVFSNDNEIETDFAVNSISHHQQSEGDNGRGNVPAIRLSYYTRVDEQQQRQVSIENSGSTVIHFQWWRAPYDDRELSRHLALSALAKHHSNAAAAQLPISTSVSIIEGTLLPGDTQVFTFTFLATSVGTYMDKWLLSTDPAPWVTFGKPSSVNEDVADRFVVVDEHVPLEVHLKCTAVDNFVPWKQRQRTRLDVEKSESWFFARRLVENILRGVEPHEVTTFKELSPADQVKRFYRDHRNSVFQDVYYSPEMLEALNELYIRARNIVEDAALNCKSEQKFITETSEGEQESQPQEHELFPNEWDGRMESAQSACRCADSVRYAKIAGLTQALREEQKKIAEEDEAEEDDDGDEDEDEDDDEEDEEDDDDDEEDEEDNDEEEEEQPPAKPKKETRAERRTRRLLERQQLKESRLEHCKKLSSELDSLYPRLQDALLSLQFSACTAPYSTQSLRGFLSNRLLTYTSETPVVSDISICQIPASGGRSHLLQSSNIQGSGIEADTITTAVHAYVRELVIRAIDEAIDLDLSRQSHFESERRKFDGIWLSSKIIPLSSVIFPAADKNPVDAIESEDLESPPQSQVACPFLLYADIDISPWFELTKTPNLPPDSTRQIDETLRWQVSQKVLEHNSFIPNKIARCAASLRQVLDESYCFPAGTKTIVLLSELSSPPVTRTALKLIQNAKASKSTISNIEPPGDAVTSADEDAVEVIVERLASHRSMKDVALLLQRALDTALFEVIYCESLRELDAQLEQTQSFISDSLQAGSEDDTDSPPPVDPLTPIRQVRILLLDHISALVDRQLRAPTSRIETARSLDLSAVPSTATTTSAATEVSVKSGVSNAPARKPPQTVGGTKMSIAEPPAPLLSTPPTPSSKVETPRMTPPTTIDREGATKALSEELNCRCAGYIIDALPFMEAQSIFAPNEANTVPNNGTEADTPSQGAPSPRGTSALVAGLSLQQQFVKWARLLQQHEFQSSHSRRAVAIVGGKGLQNKIRFIDGLLEVADSVFFTGEVAMSLYRVLTHRTTVQRLRQRSDDKATATKTIKQSGELVWSILAPAVEKLRQKASRKGVRLLLPIDFFVGETPLEDQDMTSANSVNEEEEDEEEEEEEEEDDNDEEEEGDGNSPKRSKKARRRQRMLKKKRQQAVMLLEPDEATRFGRRQFAYDGEKALVALYDQADATTPRSWHSFEQVSAALLAHPSTISGPPGVLESSTGEDDENDEDDEEAEDDSAKQASVVSVLKAAAVAPPPSGAKDWTFRAFDIGPTSVHLLSETLRETEPRLVIVNGLSGAVEFDAFADSTRELVKVLRETTSGGDDESSPPLVIAGRTTAEWLRWVETPAKPRAGEAPVRRLVDSQTLRSAPVLKDLLACRCHPLIARLAGKANTE